MSLSPEEQKEAKQAFNFADKDKDGKIGPTEIGYVMRAIGLMPTEKDIKAINDKTGGKPIDFDTFLKMSHEQVKKLAGHEVEGAFKKFDKNRIGVVETHDIKHAVLTLCEKFSDSEAEAFVKAAGGDKINIKDFNKSMSQYK